MESKIVTLARKMARVQDSCQTTAQVAVAMKYTELAEAAIRQEVLASQSAGPVSRILGKLGLK